MRDNILHTLIVGLTVALLAAFVFATKIAVYIAITLLALVIISLFVLNFIINNGLLKSQRLESAKRKAAYESAYRAYWPTRSDLWLDEDVTTIYGEDRTRIAVHNAKVYRQDRNDAVYKSWAIKSLYKAKAKSLIRKL